MSGWAEFRPHPCAVSIYMHLFAQYFFPSKCNAFSFLNSSF
jgi:hypothetical protein